MFHHDTYTTITAAEISDFEKRFRTQLINSLAGIRQAVLVGTKSLKGTENLAIFNSLIHLGAHPPLFGLISRPNSVQRDTLENIMDTGVYTLNFVDKEYMMEAHQTSARYAENVSEFDEVNFKSHHLDDCVAPFLMEADIMVEMKLQQIIDIKLNDTKMIIGSVEKVYLSKDRLANDGLIKTDDLLLAGGLDAYYSAEFLGQLPYAKP